MSRSLSASATPRIVFLISHLELIEQPSQLAREVASVIPAYAGQADIRIVDLAFADVLAFAQAVEGNSEADVFVCAGATGAYLRRQIGTPVVLMQASGHDILYALDKARETTGAAAVVRYRHPIVDLEYVRRLWGVDIKQGTYTTLAEAQALVSTLGGQGCKVIIGSSMVTQSARQHGLVGILAVSPAAIRRALDDALATMDAARAEAAERTWLNATLRHLSDGVIAVDAKGMIQAINPALASVIGVQVASSVGQDVDQLAPQLEFKRLLAEGGQRRNQVLHLGQHTVLASLYPMHEHGEVVGAVMVCQDASTVHGADRQLRMSAKRQEHRARYTLDQIIGSSPAIRSQIDLARRYAGTDSTVLIYGESGTGKELFAQGIHSASPRASCPFVAINCASLPEALLESELFGYEEGAFTGARKGGKPGLFEMAHTGTIFLDEIGDMPSTLQTRLLRVLQEREVVRLGGTQPTPINVRVIAATHRRLRERVESGECREDLYYRLSILQLRLPPLRERHGDLRALATHIIAGIAARAGLRRDFAALVDRLLPALERHRWPGNIRELENVLERAVLSCSDEGTLAQQDDLIDLLFDAEDLPVPDARRSAAGSPAARPVTELARIRDAIDRCGGNLSRAAQSMGMSRTTLWRRLKAAERSE